MHFENERWCKMGCYKMICAATNTTINEGDEVVLFYFINSLVESNPVYSEEKMETFFVPIEGTYDDYGFIEGVNERYYKDSFSLINYYLTEKYQVETTKNLKEAFRQIKWNSKELIKKNTFGFQKEINYFFVKKSFLNLLLEKRKFSPIESTAVFFKLDNKKEIKNMEVILPTIDQYLPQLQYWSVIYEWFLLTGRKFSTIVSGTQEYYLKNVLLMQDFLELELKNRYELSEDNTEEGYIYESETDEDGRRRTFEEWKVFIKQESGKG